MNTLHETVKAILKVFPETRNSDRKLIVRIYDQMGINTDRPFKEIVENTDAPSFETIRRTRQKIQAEDETLQATGKIRDARCEREMDFIGYAIGERGTL